MERKRKTEEEGTTNKPALSSHNKERRNRIICHNLWRTSMQYYTVQYKRKGRKRKHFCSFRNWNFSPIFRFARYCLSTVLSLPISNKYRRLFSSYLVVDAVRVSFLREDELLPLEHQRVRADLQSGWLRAALAVAHVHQAVVELLKKKKERKLQTHDIPYLRSTVDVSLVQ